MTVPEAGAVIPADKATVAQVVSAMRVDFMRENMACVRREFYLLKLKRMILKRKTGEDKNTMFEDITHARPYLIYIQDVHASRVDVATRSERSPPYALGFEWLRLTAPEPYWKENP